MTDPISIRVNAGAPYDVIIGRGLLGELAERSGVHDSTATAGSQSRAGSPSTNSIAACAPRRLVR